MEVAGQEAKTACGTTQCCAGLEAGIEGGIQAIIHELWTEHHEEENWGFLLVNADNGFNKLEHYTALWLFVTNATFAFKLLSSLGDVN